MILGAGPAGLAAATKLAERGLFDVTVFERAAAVGGNAGSFDIEGVRVDFGSHRLHPSCPPEILADIRGMLGADLLRRPRHGRIRLRGRWVHFPLKPLHLVTSLPPSFALGVCRDAIARRGSPSGEETFATVLERGLGRTICRDFYFPYAEKIWGVAPEQIDAEQARRRVSAGSISRLMRKVIRGALGRGEASGRYFFYPKRGFGQISEAYHEAALEAGARVLLETAVSGVEVGSDGSITVTGDGPSGTSRFSAHMVLSTIPLPSLAAAISPPMPPHVRESISALKYRSMVLVYLVLLTDRMSEYDAHYFPGSEVEITRLSEPKNYAGLPRSGTTVLCAEIPCDLGDATWDASDDSLGRLVVDVMKRSGLPVSAPVNRVFTRRLSHAYPIYTRGYQQHFDRLDEWVSGIDGVLSFGRQGLFAHDNTHHTMAMAYAASECLDGTGRFDRNLWSEYRRKFESHVVED
jgi:protoporphyrinogen oxidase